MAVSDPALARSVIHSGIQNISKLGLNARFLGVDSKSLDF
jgi:hypothetical protein